jgi:hypothetical protein
MLKLDRTDDEVVMYREQNDFLVKWIIVRLSLRVGSDIKLFCEESEPIIVDLRYVFVC